MRYGPGDPASRFALHSTAPEPRANVEQRILDAGGGSVRYVRDPTGEGNSDHRELARAGAPVARAEGFEHHAASMEIRENRPST